MKFKRIVIMPEIFRQYGFLFMFFSKEHEPIHVHVKGKDGDAKFNLVGDKFELYEAHNIKMTDLKRIERAIKENTDIIIKRWEEYFNSDND